MNLIVTNPDDSTGLDKNSSLPYLSMLSNSVVDKKSTVIQVRQDMNVEMNVSFSLEYYCWAFSLNNPVTT